VSKKKIENRIREKRERLKKEIDLKADPLPKEEIVYLLLLLLLVLATKATAPTYTP